MTELVVRAPVNQLVVTEMIRAALLSSTPSLLGACIDPDTGKPLFPKLAARNERLLAARAESR
jgi:hypothetical protein